MRKSLQLRTRRILLSFLLLLVCAAIAHAQPSITGISPSTAAPGQSVTITGSGFFGIITVFFGATKATIQQASYNSLVVTVPIGATYGPVSVLTDNGISKQIAYSGDVFMPTYAGTSYDFYSGSFQSGVEFSSGQSFNYNARLSINDIDQDRKADILGNVSNGFVVFRNTAVSGVINSSSLAAPIFFSKFLLDFTVADVNNDGRFDAVGLAGNLFIYPNQSSPGTIAFGTPIQITAGIVSPLKIVATDFDLDGKTDLAVLSSNGPSSSSLTVFRNTSSTYITSFEKVLVSNTLPTSEDLKTGDLTHDGKPEIILAQEGNGLGSRGGALVLQNNCSPGIISFGAQVFFETLYNDEAPVNEIAVGDLDGDGNLDISLIGFGGGFNVFRNNGGSVVNTGLFSAPVHFSGTEYSDIQVADLNGDGKADVVLTYRNGDLISVYKNTGTPGVINGNTFAAPVAYDGGDGPITIALGDIDGDKRSDMITGGYNGNTISITRKSNFIPPVTISGFSPGYGYPGTVVTVTGNGFNPNPAYNSVQIGNGYTFASSATETSLTFAVPGGSSSARIYVTNGQTGYTGASSQNFVVLGSGSGGSQFQTEAETNESIRVHPNPSPGSFSVTVNLEEKSEVKLTLRDLMGKEMLNEEIVLDKGTNTLSYQPKDTRSGIYIVEVRTGRWKKSIKLLMNK